MNAIPHIPFIPTVVPRTAILRDYILSFDVETSGPFLGYNFMTSFAFVLTDALTGTIVDTFSAYLPPQPGRYWDAGCVATFWNTHPALYAATLEGMNAQTKPIETIFNSLVQWIQHHAEDKNITLFSDNPSFDTPWINAYLSPPYTLQTIFGIYRRIIDSTSLLYGYSRENPLRPRRDLLQQAADAVGMKRGPRGEYPFHQDNQGNHLVHSHSPLDDAMLLGITVFHFLQAAKGKL
jgi:hypothetical protein